MKKASDSKFVARKWNTGNDKSNESYDVWNKIIYNTEVLESSLCHYNDAYILVKGVITATATQV